MRLSCLVVSLILSGAATAARADAMSAMTPARMPAMTPGCRVPATATAAPEPPAWLLLAGAVALLGAGRLAARR